MIPVAYIEHQLPGRVRLRVPSRRGEVPFFEKVVRELCKHPAIRELTATPLTGSITLQHLEPLQPIIAAAADQKLFETKVLEPTTKARESRPATDPDKGPDLANGLATGLSGLCLFQAAQGNVLGSAAENFWLSFGAHRTLGRADVAAGFAALGVLQLLRGQLFGPASSLFFYALAMRQIAALELLRPRGSAVAATRTAKSAGTSNGFKTGAAARAVGADLTSPVGAGQSPVAAPLPACGTRSE
jgi:hypothetical protein